MEPEAIQRMAETQRLFSLALFTFYVLRGPTRYQAVGYMDAALEQVVV